MSPLRGTRPPPGALRHRIVRLGALALVPVAFFAGVGLYISQPWVSGAPPVAPAPMAVAAPAKTGTAPADDRKSPARLRDHVRMLSETFHPRDWTHPQNMARCVEYIRAEFAAAGAETSRQEVPARGAMFHNVIGRFGKGRGDRLVVGAHYDSCGDTPGADDNASGVAALIELAHLLGRDPPDREVELVAYALEEPPFFRTPEMGSAVHARSIAAEVGGRSSGRAAAAPRTRVIVLEMVGYFSDEPGLQKYPSPLFRMFYPDRGNFIAVVGRSDQGEWVAKVKAAMLGASDLPVHSIRAPASIQGVDYSDHASYWPHGIEALMVTDTSFYRNPHYHTPRDTPDRLDYDRMAKVVLGVHQAVRSAR